MKMGNIFETRQRAQELLEQAISIWRQSPQSEHLEGLAQDPVMTLLMSALVYQTDETENDIELLKQEVLSEFVHLLTPYELGHAVPATAVIETALIEGIPEWIVDAGTTFRLTDSEYDFMPVLRSRVLNARVQSLMRMDGRRWKVTLKFSSPVRDLSGFTFAVKNQFFEDLKVSYKKYYLPLVKPWDYSQLPLNKCFTLDSALYQGLQIFNASRIGLDLYASQNVRLFCIKDHDASQYLPDETDTLELVFEFSGVTDQFVFDKKQLALNCIILAEAQQGQASLSGDHPIARVAGYNENSSSTMPSSQFLHLLRPAEDQIYGYERVEVRRIAADRFNQGRLLRLLATLLNKYHSDFYAFQNHPELSNDGTMRSLQDMLKHLMQVCESDQQRSIPGIYLLLHPDSQTSKKDISLSVSYLTTHGANINNLLGSNTTFQMPAAFEQEASQLLVPPTPGSNEVSDRSCEESMMRYHIITNDRIVTPADIKAFCYNELLTRYGIGSNSVKDIQVNHRLAADPHGCGYEILTEIVLEDSTFIKRSLSDRLPHVETLLKKMMEVRSTNIYPIHVSIRIEEKPAE